MIRFGYALNRQAAGPPNMTPILPAQCSQSWRPALGGQQLCAQKQWAVRGKITHGQDLCAVYYCPPCATDRLRLAESRSKPNDSQVQCTQSNPTPPEKATETRRPTHGRGVGENKVWVHAQLRYAAGLVDSKPHVRDRQSWTEPCGNYCDNIRPRSGRYDTNGVL